MAKDQPEWRTYEDLVAGIQRELAPLADVKTHHKVLGRKTETLREIDVALLQKVGQYDVLIAIECKDLKRAVNVNHVGTFMELLDDVGANRGVMVSARGFSEAAKRRAVSEGIDLYRAIDVQSSKWSERIEMPTVIDVRVIDRYGVRLSTSGNLSVKPSDLPSLVLLREDGSKIGSVFELLCELWKQAALPVEVGVHEDLSFIGEPTFVEGQTGLVQVGLTLTIHVDCQLIYAEMPIASLRGLSNEITGGLIAKQLATGNLPPAGTPGGWRFINDVDQAPKRPQLLLTARLGLENARPKEGGD